MTSAARRASARRASGRLEREAARERAGSAVEPVSGASERRTRACSERGAVMSRSESCVLEGGRGAQGALGIGVSPPVIDATKIIDYRRLSKIIIYHAPSNNYFFNFNLLWIFFAYPDRAQREQPIGGLKKFVRARVRSAWRVD